MSDGMVFCRACGGEMHGSAPFCPHCGAPATVGTPDGVSGDGIPRSFGNAISICFRKYAVASGRAPRAEFWFFFLFQILAQVATSIIGVLVFSGYAVNVPTDLLALALFLPAIMVTIRRLHDLDRSGWWMLLALIPLVGAIILLVWNCTRGTSGPNRFGPENGRI